MHLMWSRPLTDIHIDNSWGRTKQCRAKKKRGANISRRTVSCFLLIDFGVCVVLGAWQRPTTCATPSTVCVFVFGFSAVCAYSLSCVATSQHRIKIHFRVSFIVTALRQIQAAQPVHEIQVWRFLNSIRSANIASGIGFHQWDRQPIQ